MLSFRQHDRQYRQHDRQREMALPSCLGAKMGGGGCCGGTITEAKVERGDLMLGVLVK